jgi:hypothetical protein
MRFQIEGARKFLRLDGQEFRDLDIYGDCGAFTYVNEYEPPYSPEEILDFYDHCGFTHGCSVDHIIFDYEDREDGLDGVTDERSRRFEITLANAADFLDRAKRISHRFTPLGVVQGWSPGSMAVAAHRLVQMGYTYLAIGGMVPLKSDQIRRCLRAIRAAIPGDVRIHVLGFAKADELDSFGEYRITSFDTTSPLIRAFKDEKHNYYLPTEDGRLNYYTAVRIPQSLENDRLQTLIKRGVFTSEDLARMEASALGAIRAFDRGETDLEQALSEVMQYNAVLVTERPYKDVSDAPKLRTLQERYRRTLGDRPWTKCNCAICSESQIEVAIFRASNRNKRRGIHNLFAFRQIVSAVNEKQELSCSA